MHDQPTHSDASAIILAGGRSSRMGQTKALLPFDNKPLIAHIVHRLATIFCDIVVVVAPDQELPPLPVTVIHDTVAHQGPVGGICYGLQAARSEVCFVTSCDAPFLNLPLISSLVSQIADYDVVVPYWEERLQPLHAVYRRSCALLLQAQLERGELRPISLYKEVRTLEVGPDEILRLDPEGDSFRNMNCPDDYQAALSLLHEMHSRPPLMQNVTLPCTIELFGLARLKAKTGQVTLALPPGANLQVALTALAETLPDLVGPILTQDHRLTQGYACNLNGREFVRDLAIPLHSDDHVLIFSSDAGG